MKIKKAYIFFLLLLPGLIMAQKAEWKSAYALIGCRIVPGIGAKIEDGVIILRNGLIESVGHKAKIVVPEDVKIINAEGLIAYPGFIDAYSPFFAEMPPEPPPDSNELIWFGIVAPNNQVSGCNPDFMAFDHLKFSKNDQNACHKQGILTALIVPQKRMFSGQSVLLNLNEKNPSEMVILNPVALHIIFRGGRGVYPTSTMGVMAFIRQASIDAAYYKSQKEFLARKQRGVRRPVYNPFLETISSYFLGRKPIVFACNNINDTKRAMRLIAECNFNGLIAGASEGWRIVDMLKAAEVPLLLSVNFSPPETSFFSQQGKDIRDRAEKEIFPANPAKLSQADLDFALTSFGLQKNANFLGQVRKAVKAGLAEDEALKALTIHPARFLGIDNQLGTIDRGKIGNIVLTDGEIFKEGTRVKMVFVDGIRFEIKEAKNNDTTVSTNVTRNKKGGIRATESMIFTRRIMEDVIETLLSHDVGHAQIKINRVLD